jgi:pyridoxal phosphate enzyme (YggS family)
MTTILETIESNLTGIRQRINEACQRSGRRSDDVALVAVTKYAQSEWVRALIDLGQVRLGESRPQQLAVRAEEMPDHVEWHLIGHLQRNKVDLILPAVQLIHSADSLRLLKRISQSAASLERSANVLLEVNVSGEESKDGFTPAALREAWQEIRRLDHLDVQGLMTMAPQSDKPESARTVFTALRELRDELARSDDGRPLPELSMGMSRDFEVAIEEGATLIRIGSSLFEGLS